MIHGSSTRSGDDRRQKRIAAGALLVIAALYGVVLSIGLDRPHLAIWDEYFTLDRSAAFLETGDWLQVTYNHRRSLVKPPAQYWLTALSLRAGMPAELAVRSWSAVFGVGAVLATAWLAMAVLPSQPAVGVIAALLVAANPALLRYSRTGLLETGQVLSVVLTLAALFRAGARPRWWLLAGAAAGFGALQKAPLALGVAAPTIVVLLWSGRLRMRRVLRSPWPWVGGALALTLTTFWPLLQTARFGPLWVNHYWSSQLVGRLSPTISGEAPGWLDVRWLALFREWPLPWIATPALLIGSLLTPAVRRSTETLWLIALASAALAALYLAAGNVYPRYLLPIVPLLAVVAAHLIVTWVPSVKKQLFIAAFAVLVQIPALWEQHGLVSVDRSDAVAAARELRETLRPGEMAVIAYGGPDDLIPPTAILSFARLDRSARMLSLPRLQMLSARMGRHSLRGTVARRDLATLRAIFPRAQPLAEFGPLVVWHAPSARQTTR